MEALLECKNMHAHIIKIGYESDRFVRNNLVNNGVHPNEFTFAIVVKACANLADVEI
jgi:hypothetical protein